jgi:[CysO sulfur-carrier protein]-S-L-cysteine hydrolase
VVADAPLQLPRHVADEIAAHARAGLPDEACGIVSGVAATATRFHPAGNADASPFRYSIDSQDLLRIVTDIDDAEEDLLAIYHSHTRSPAFPSRTDVELAFWPDAAYLIVSLASDPPDLKAFTIREGRIAKRELLIT